MLALVCPPRTSRAPSAGILTYFSIITVFAGIKSGPAQVHYLGFAHDAAHQSFLANVTDRASLVIITTHGSSLYEASLAETVSQVFSDILASESKENEPLQSESEDEG